ncbi:MAG: hypothetical protein ABSG91_21935 [Syntrophobacteraceae bacterium]|jgi:hypothetical protein
MSDYDFSRLPDQPKQYDFSALPDQPGIFLTGDAPPVGMMPDLYTGEQVPDTGAKPLFTPTYRPRPPERLYRENAPQILQDLWNITCPVPTVGPLREHQLRPDLRMDSPGVYALPDEPYIPANLSEEAEIGLRRGAAHVAAGVLSLGYALAKGELPDEREGYTPIRQEAYGKTYDVIARVLQVKDVAEPDSFSAALVRGVGEAGMPLVETMALSALTGGATAPGWIGLASEYPTLVAKAVPIVNSALTRGLQGGLEPYQPGTQAATGAAIGAILGGVSPYGRIARSVVGAGLGAGQEYFTNPNATTQGVVRNATLMAGFAALAAKERLTLEEAVAGTIFDWWKNKGYTPQELSRALQIQGISPILNEFAEDMTAPQMENRSGVIASIRPGELGAAEQPAGPSMSMDKLGFRQMEQKSPKGELDIPEDSADASKSGATFGFPEAETPVVGAAAAARLDVNRATGAAFEQAIGSDLKQSRLIISQQITIRTGGVRTRVDFVTRDPLTGEIGCIECKASSTAPLTKNQKVAFPDIEQSGGRIVGKGKPGFHGGMQIPPTEVKIIRGTGDGEK